MAVERVREGEAAPAVIASYGFNRTTIYKWLAAAAKPGVGLGALKSRPAPGRPRSLTPRQEQQVFRWINGNDPRQYGLDFGLWTRSVVAELVERKFGIRLGLPAIGELLAKLNLTPQRPLQRAYQRDPEAIERWQRVSYPAIARQARAEGSEVFLWDELGFRADAVHGRTWGVKGQTPVAARCDQPVRDQHLQDLIPVRSPRLRRGQALTDHADRERSAAQHAEGGIAERVDALGVKVVRQHAAQGLPYLVEREPLLPDDHRIPRLGVARGQTRQLGWSAESPRRFRKNVSSGAITGFFPESPLRPPVSFVPYRNEGISEGASKRQLGRGAGE